MQICGIVCEYNPFHLGHAWHVSRVRELLGEDTAVVGCMSGDFVQRGEAALLPKHLRARAAVLGGADLILELPVPYALSSAEGFAQAGVRILSGLGVLTHLSFGAETADEGFLRESAAILLEHDTVAATLANLKTGVSYAAARERALFAKMQERAALLSLPNNILAVEYCKAVLRQELELSLLPIPRRGAEHDGQSREEGFASASAIRAMVRGGNGAQAAGYLPESTRGLLRNAMTEGRALTDTSRLETAMLSRLMELSPQQLASLPGASEGLEHRLFAAIRENRSVECIAMAAKTKRYALSRIRRMLYCAFLGVTKEDAALPAPYIRVLAFNDRGREVLRLARKRAALPLLTKPAHVEELSPEAGRIFDLEARACDQYHLALPSWKALLPGADWRQDAIYVK